jgi:alanyl-tRNA synthetase
MQAALAVHEADRLLAAVAPDAAGRRLISEVYDGWDANGLKTIASSLVARDPVAVVLVASGPQPLVVVACAPSLGLDASAALRRITGRFGGRGGGRPDLAQAGGLSGNAAEIAAFGRDALGGA